MKRFRTILALILTLSLAASIIAITTAETVPVEPWQADLRALMDDSSVPRSTSLKYDVSTPENAQTHETAVEKVNGSGLTMRIDFSMIAPENYTKDDWAQLDQWLEETASRTVQGLAADTENLAKALSDAVASGRKAKSDAETAPAWTRDDWQLTGLTVTIPYYPELSEGVNGTATQRLQEKLAQYGFLDDKADGYFGAKTRAAVEMLERHVRELEQDLIDARPTPEPTPLPIPTPAPTETMAAPEDAPLAEEPTVEPSVEPEPTPVTPVDGVADALLQAYLYSEDFAPYRGTLQQGDQGDAVLRMQRRLLQLGCMTGAADGHYGGNTARSVRIFQYYNDLELTGAADAATLSRLFSEDAKAPENAMLTAGSSGEAVKALQLRLARAGLHEGLGGRRLWQRHRDRRGEPSEVSAPAGGGRRPRRRGDHGAAGGDERLGGEPADRGGQRRRRPDSAGRVLFRRVPGHPRRDGQRRRRRGRGAPAAAAEHAGILLRLAGRRSTARARPTPSTRSRSATA